MPTGVYIHKPLSEERKKKISSALMGRKISAVTRKKLSLASSVSQKGRKASIETKLKMSLSHIGKNTWSKGCKRENALSWKGENAGYVAFHMWVARRKGQPDTCEHCGMSGLKGRQIHWANKDHKYRRVLDDYIRLCKNCHTEYDIENNNYQLRNKTI
jgi:hypothetical protein